jgi:hypothetical protein
MGKDELRFEENPVITLGISLLAVFDPFLIRADFKRIIDCARQKMWGIITGNRWM